MLRLLIDVFHAFEASNAIASSNDENYYRFSKVDCYNYF